MSDGAEERSAAERASIDSCIDEAIAFVAAQPGGAERALALHRRRPDGRCTGCVYTLTHWPCAMAAIALGALKHASYRPAPV